jgi:hypothetical protein
MLTKKNLFAKLGIIFLGGCSTAVDPKDFRHLDIRIIDKEKICVEHPEEDCKPLGELSGYFVIDPVSLELLLFHVKQSEENGNNQEQTPTTSN